MRITFVWPTVQFGGGVLALFELANALARIGHDVRVVHGPAWPGRIDRVEQIDWFTFEPTIRHHVVDELDDPSLPDGDIVFAPGLDARLGLPVVVIQGHRLLSEEIERPAYEGPFPKACVARWLVDVGRDYGVAPHQLWHIPCGIDHAVFRAPPPAPRPHDVAVLWSSHVAKGFPTALDALSRLRARRPDLSVVVFSQPRPDPPLPDWMTFVQGPDHETLARDVYGRVKVFVQSSFVEGFGLTALEAMACGAALVTTDNGGSAEYADDGDNALVVPPRDPDALAAAVERILDDHALRSRLADAGRRRALDFDWNVSARRLTTHLEDYLADPARFRVAADPRLAAP
ncbi:MAG: glycosyltransferase family 4 protein [Acidimicrobiales bacterium]|nr:glycosyltransferase family 4 protein [Acidimicrobiales bacterium]